MELMLNDKYKVENCSYGFVLKEFRTIKGKDGKERKEWTDCGYYGRIEQLKASIIDKEISADPSILANMDYIIELKKQILDF